MDKNISPRVIAGLKKIIPDKQPWPLRKIIRQIDHFNKVKDKLTKLADKLEKEKHYRESHNIRSVIVDIRNGCMILLSDPIIKQSYLQSQIKKKKRQHK